MVKVVIESPLSAPDRDGIERNKTYAVRCMKDSLARGEAPYASHLLFDRPGLLDDQISTEREMGMLAGFAWGDYADLCAVYVDNGISRGMQAGIDRYRHRGIPIEFRRLDA
jgi:hypothetical protein